MASLCEMPNIGKQLEILLKNAGINTPEELKQVGSKEAFLRISVSDPEACLSKLSALEGAIQGVRWHHLPDDTKADLKVFYNQVQIHE